MADRTLRGSRLGAVSYETEYGAEPAPRNIAAYRCPRGHEFSVPFSEEAEIPTTWECRLDGTPGRAHRRPRAGGEEGQAAAYPLGHAHGAAHHRRSRRGPGRAPGRPARPPRAEERLTGPARPRQLHSTLGVTTVAPSVAVWPCGPADCGVDAPLGDPHERLAHDRAAHLALAALALGERDRHLDDPEARPQCAPGQVDLEAVALRRHRGVVDALQHRAPVGAVARRSRRAGRCPAPAGCRGCRRARAVRATRPVDDRAAGHPARTEHEVGVARARSAAAAAARARASRRRPSRPGRRSRRPDPSRSRRCRPRPGRPSRCGAGRARGRRASASASASLPVPSGLPSSTTRTCASGTAARTRADDRLDVVALVVRRDDDQHARTRRRLRWAHVCTISSDCGASGWRSPALRPDGPAQPRPAASAARTYSGIAPSAGRQRLDPCAAAPCATRTAGVNSAPDSLRGSRRPGR